MSAIHFVAFRKKEQMKRKSPSCKNLERFLFHGTIPRVVDSICKQNFDWREHGKNATLFGEGSYFALHAWYSNSYSREDEQNRRFMFLASVLVGEYAKGKPSYRKPPVKNTQSKELYDSCADHERNPSIFVTFDVDQCYPSYLIEYLCPSAQAHNTARVFQPTYTAKKHAVRSNQTSAGSKDTVYGFWF